MKYIYMLLIFIILTSCNENLNCDGYKYEDPICLPGFDYDEVDTIKIRFYKKNKSFESCIDSASLFLNKELKNHYQLGGISVSPNISIPTDCDWEIELNDTSIYRVTNIKMGATSENTLLENRVRCNLISYNLNDSVMERRNITISSQHNRIKRSR